MKKPSHLTMLKLGAAAILLAVATGASGASHAAEWKLGHILPPDHPANRALEAAAKEISGKTQGRIDIKVFPAGQIGNAKEIITGLTLGTTQMAFDGAGILSQWNRRLSALEAPYLAADFAHLKRISESAEGQKLYEELRQRHKIRTLDLWYYGTRHLTNSKRAVTALADVAGLKLRVPEIALSLEWARAIGATPTPMAFPELYLGMQTGIVDGQENPLPTINAGKFFEVQKHLALTGHLVQSVSPLVAEDAWMAASEADRKVVVEVLKGYGERVSADIAKSEAELVASLESKGMQVTRPDRDAFRKAMAPVYAKFEEVWGKEATAALLAVK